MNYPSQYIKSALLTNEDIVSIGFNVNCYYFKVVSSPQETVENIVGFCHGFYLKLLPPCFFFSFQNMLEIISKHARDTCIFSFTYNLIVTS